MMMIRFFFVFRVSSVFLKINKFTNTINIKSRYCHVEVETYEEDVLHVQFFCFCFLCVGVEAWKLWCWVCDYFKIAHHFPSASSPFFFQSLEVLSSRCLNKPERSWPLIETHPCDGTQFTSH